jgi:diguanylate cyclase (GGDEF)-like protein/PAS domain S-box-containing protein
MKIWLAKISYIGSLNIGPLFLMLALVQSQKEYFVSGWKRKMVLWLVPMIILLLVFTNEWHHLIWSGFRWDSDATRNMLYYDSGFLYWVTPTYAYLLVLLATVILAQNAFQSPKIYRRQAWGLVGSTLLPWISNIIWLLKIGPFPGQNLTAIFFTITGIIMVVNMRSLKLLDLVPIARHQLVEIMQDAMIVLDNLNRVVDLNPAAAKILDTSQDDAVGQQIETVLQRWPDLVKQFLNTDQISTELTFERTGNIQYFDLQISPLLLTQKNSSMGRLISLRNITEYKNLFREVEKMAVTDSLTGLYNRRHFMRMAAREIESALRYRRQTAIMMVDLDGFKKVNDTFGHLVGDQLLQEVAQICQDNSRNSDVPARFGGEEFIFLLPETGFDGAYDAGERLRRAIAQIVIDTPKGNVTITASLGIATLTKEIKDLNILIHQADQALYRAKNTGHNQTILYEVGME